MLATDEWDVSYSGYCRTQDRLSQGGLDIALTIQHELSMEIGTIPADNRVITFTGLYHNSATGAIDMLTFWRTEADAEMLVSLLSKKRPNLKAAFRTTKLAQESYVWGTNNLIVGFNGQVIDRALKAIADLQGKPVQLIPEAKMALELALHAAI